ncbi:MAG: transposase [Myxococcota bacterium]
MVFVTVSAVGRQMRFVPTVPVRDSIWFIFAWLLSDTEIQVHELTFMSNHFHLVATDPKAELSDLLQVLDSLVSRQLNALRGETGSNFERNPRWQRICDDESVVEKCIYSVVNPLKAHLVERLRDWKAPTTFGLDYGESVTFKRPKCGLWKEVRVRRRRRGRHASAGRWRYMGRSKAPGSVTFKLVRPRVRMELTARELRAQIREGALAEQLRLQAERRRTGRSVLGWRRVVTQHYLATPKGKRVLFRRNPTVTGTDPVKVDAMLETMATFRSEYRVAMRLHRERKNPTFPYGTNRMARRYNVPCATAPPRPHPIARS